jgi:signal peptide peptidase SppA
MVKMTIPNRRTTMLTKQNFFSQVDKEPLFLNPEYEASGLLMALTRHQITQDASSIFTPATMLAEGKPYRMRGHMATIPIHGYLAHRDNGHIPGLYTGYDYITNLLSEALADEDVAGIALDVNSPGGMVNGAFEAAEAIHEANKIKPVTAVVDASAYSAAYLLSSAAGKIVAPRTGGVGSIGVVTMHVDLSKALEEAGIKVTMLYAGDYKVDGNPYESLNDGAKSRIEGRLQQSYNLFVNTVANYRGLESDAVVATKAGLFQGDGALQIRLIDAVMPPRAAFTAFAQDLVTLGDSLMANEKQEATAEVANEQSTETVKNEAYATERARIAGILECEESGGRTALAKHLAFNTDMSVESAVKLLSVSPKETAQTSESNAFMDVMNNSEHPNVGAEEMSGSEDLDVVSSIVSNYKNYTGRVN